MRLPGATDYSFLTLTKSQTIGFGIVLPILVSLSVAGNVATLVVNFRRYVCYV